MRAKIKYLKSIKRGDRFSGELSLSCDGIVSFKCLNNDPRSRKMYLRVKWSNADPTDHILKYNNKAFRNVLLLNNKVGSPLTVEEQLKEAIKSENYELAEKLKKQIPNNE